MGIGGSTATGEAMICHKWHTMVALLTSMYLVAVEMIPEFTWNLLSKYTLEYIMDRYVTIDTITITINKISVKKHRRNSFEVMKERLE